MSKLPHVTHSQHERTCYIFCANWSKRCKDMVVFLIFQDGGCPPSWICYSRVWTTHKVDFGGLCHCANWFESVQQFR